MSQAQSEKFPYRSDIDGLRAIAVLAVLFYHCGFEAFAGGYVGVDVFFVISGFLIASILRKESESGRINLKNFWLRRIRRLFPAMGIVVVCSSIIFSILYPPTYLKDFGGSLISHVLIRINIFFSRNSGYFDSASEFRPLLHMWSLAVEEQFYLIFPVLIAFATVKRLRAHIVMICCGSLILLSFVLSVLWVKQSPNMGFFLLPSRAWELGVGVFLAYLNRPRHRTYFTDGMSVLGVMAIAGAVILYNKNTPFPSWYALLPVLGAASIIFFHTGQTYVGRLLENRFMVFAGKISYSLYLWHWVVIVVAHVFSPAPFPTSVKYLLVLISIAAGMLSYFFIEKPTRQSTLRFSDKKLLVSFVISSLLFMGYGYFLKRSNGWGARLGRDYVPPSRSPRLKECIDADNGSASPFCSVGPSIQPIDFLVIGDSHAFSILPAIEVLAKKYERHGYFGAASGCLPFLGAIPAREKDSRRRCKNLIESSLATVEANGIKTVLLVSRWTYYTDRATDGTFQPILNEEVETPSIEGSRLVFEAQLRATVARFQDAGAKLIILNQVPQHAVSNEDAFYRSRLFNGDPNESGVLYSDHRQQQAFVKQVFAKEASVQKLDPDPIYCPDAKRCKLYQNFVPLYFDNNHLSVEGSRLLEGLLDQVLKPK